MDDLGPKMQACDERERKFVLAYLTNGGNGADAAAAAGYSTHLGANRVQAHHLLHRERILSALEEVGRKEFRSLLVPCLVAMRRLVANPDHPHHASTVGTLLSRLGFSEKSAIDISVTGTVEVNHTDAALSDLRNLIALGIPEAKLEEIFGFSGLGRYKRMLAEQDRKAGRLIEDSPEPPGKLEPKPVSIG
jgi:hypothetical protein